MHQDQTINDVLKRVGADLILLEGSRHMDKGPTERPDFIIVSEADLNGFSRLPIGLDGLGQLPQRAGQAGHEQQRTNSGQNHKTDGEHHGLLSNGVGALHQFVRRLTDQNSEVQTISVFLSSRNGVQDIGIAIHILQLFRLQTQNVRRRETILKAELIANNALAGSVMDVVVGFVGYEDFIIRRGLHQGFFKNDADVGVDHDHAIGLSLWRPNRHDRPDRRGQFSARALMFPVLGDRRGVDSVWGDVKSGLEIELVRLLLERIGRDGFITLLKTVYADDLTPAIITPDVSDLGVLAFHLEMRLEDFRQSGAPGLQRAAIIRVDAAILPGAHDAFNRRRIADDESLIAGDLERALDMRGDDASLGVQFRPRRRPAHRAGLDKVCKPDHHRDGDGHGDDQHQNLGAKRAGCENGRLHEYNQ